MAVIFNHDVLHSGGTVVAGNKKKTEISIMTVQL